MSDVMMPTNLSVAKVSFRYIDNTGISRAMFTRRLRVASFGGDTLGASIQLSPHGGASSKGQMERAQLRAWLASLQGPQNPTYLYDPSYRMRGSFPTGELLTNNTFANGTTGWQTGTQHALQAADRIARATRTAVTAVDNILRPVSPVTGLSQYMPYVARFMVNLGRGAYQFRINDPTNSIIGSDITAPGLLSQVFIAHTASITPTLVDTVFSGHLAGDYVTVPYASLSRCMLVDNGANALLQSDSLGTTWTQTGLAALTSNTGTAPDGTATADIMVENASNSMHGISQSGVRSSVAADLCAYGYFQRGSGSRNVLLGVGNDASNLGRAVFNLGDGTLSISMAVGSATNTRAFIVDVGNGIYFCSVIARLTAAATIYATVQFHNGSSNIYTGDGTSSIAGWRVGAAVSSVPTRGAKTTTTASPAGTAQSGSALYVKGLPASTNGLLLAGDQFEVITSRGSELKIVTAPLNSDAAGLGYLQFTPPLRGTVADNAPIIVHQPMGRFVFTGEAVGWDEEPGFITSASAEFEEA